MHFSGCGERREGFGGWTIVAIGKKTTDIRQVKVTVKLKYISVTFTYVRVCTLYIRMFKVNNSATSRIPLGMYVGGI